MCVCVCFCEITFMSSKLEALCAMQSTTGGVHVFAAYIWQRRRFARNF